MKNILAAALVACLALPACHRVEQPPAEWAKIECPLADLEADQLFESVKLLDDFEKGVGAWRAGAGGQQAKATLARATDEKHAGQAALRVDFEFIGKKDYEYIEVGSGATLEQPGLGLGLWVKGDGTPLSLRVRVQDKTGETHQVDLERLTFAGWRFLAARFDQPGAGCWGGDANHRLDYPCRLTSVLADRPQRGYAGRGSFWIDDVQLVRRRKVIGALAIEVLGKQLGNVYEPGQTVHLRVSGPGESIRWHVEDFWGAAIAKGEGPAASADVRFALPKAGHYVCSLERVAKGKVAEAKLFRCAALPPPDPTKRNPFVGLGCHFRHWQYPPECMDLLARLGITQIRDEISWGNVEREKGKLAMPEWGDQWVNRARELGIEPLLIFDYANPLYDAGGFPVSDEAVAGYARYAAWLAQWLRGRVTTFEVWNEYSIGCGMRGKPKTQTPSRYARMLDATYRAVKAAVPDVTIVGVGGEHSQHHVEFIDGMLRAGAHKAMDAFSVHSYRYPSSPEATDLLGEIQNVASLARRRGATARVWVTEIGWPTHTGPRGVDERTQARYIVRTMALLQATRVVEKTHWYDFKNDGLQREYNEHNFGVVWHEKFNLAPKPAAVALGVFARMTAGATVQRLWRDGDAYAVLYHRPDGSALAVAWTAKGERTVAVKGRRVRVCDAMGNPAPAGDVVLTETPVYVTGRTLRWP
ncbi:hypothetical protein HQ576_04260 [bacterium]|nr:hypothetical protein [bacterium]